MTKKELEYIIIQLLKWKKERHLTTFHQKKGLLANICEELTEYKRAINEYDRVDALCDMSIFLLNILEEKDIEKIIEYYNKEIHNFKNSRVEFVGLITYGFTPLVQSISLQEQTYLYIKDWNWDEVCFKITIFLILLENMIKQYGLSFYEALSETLKEIQSRTGHWDELQKKFIKDEGIYGCPKTTELTLEYDEIKEDKDYWILLTNNKEKKRLKKWYKANYNINKEKIRICSRCNEKVVLKNYDIESHLCIQCINDLSQEQTNFHSYEEIGY